MIDYKLLADNDPGGDLEVAFNLMYEQTVATYPQKLMTYIDIASRAGFFVSAELQNAVVDNVGIPSWVDIALSRDGVDVNDEQTQSVLSSIVSEETALAISALGVELISRFPQLTSVRHLDKARVMRADGRV